MLTRILEVGSWELRLSWKGRRSVHPWGALGLLKEQCSDLGPQRFLEVGREALAESAVGGGAGQRPTLLTAGRRVP